MRDMYRHHWQRLVGLFKRALRMDRRLNIGEFTLLADAISDYGRMIQAHEQWTGRPPQYVIVEVTELAYRFRETEQVIKDALLLLKTARRAEPVPRCGYWKLKVAGTPSGREGVKAA